MKEPMKGESSFSMVFTFCFLLLQTFQIFPLYLSKKISDYINEVWKIEDGLPHNCVQAMLQTRDGYIWLGTQEGLARFDGVRFTVFDKIEVKERKKTNVKVLLEGRDGSLWIGTAHEGLIRYKKGNFTAYTKKDGLTGNCILSICEDKTGGIWVGTYAGLNLLRGGSIRTFTTTDGLSGNIIMSIFEDHVGNLWFAALDKGLNRLNLKDNKFYTYSTREGLANNSVKVIFEDRQGGLWFGTHGGGLNRCKHGEFTTFSEKEGLSSDYVTTIYEDSGGSLWIGTQGGGLNRFKDNVFSVYSSKEGLSYDSVSSIFEDREGGLWVGTHGGGVNRLKNRKVATYFINESLSDHTLGAILQDSKGAMWIGTYNDGIARYKDGQFSLFSTKQGLSHNIVRCLWEDQQGNLWIGTQGGGLNCFRDGKFITYTKADGLPDNFISSIYEDRRGNLWIGTRNSGLICFREGKFSGFSGSVGLPHSHITEIIEDSRGNLWIATIGSGLLRYRYDDRGFTVFTTKEGLSCNYIFCIYEDQEKILWIGTYGGGLNRFENGKFTAITTEGGLFNDIVYRILEDEKNNLWMSCNKGIFQVNKKELNEFARGRMKSIKCFSYGKGDGMVNIDCTGASSPAGWKSRDGKLWFPTAHGAAVIDPNNIKSNTFIPPVIVEKLVVDGENIDLKDNDEMIEISPGTKKFEFHFTALSFAAPKKITFKHKLEGFDEEWVDMRASAERAAPYTNLAPGKYCFRVKACNNDGIWNETGASLRFYLKPFFYQTYWFYGICAICVILLGLGLHLLRVRQIIIRERRKYEKVRLSPEAAERYLKKLLHFMEAEKPYLDSDISLPKLSENIHIPDHYLSQVINARLKQNFYDFINFYRIEEAKRILTTPKQNHLTIHAIAFEVGYNSKSAFNRAFKKYVKMTPFDFRKNHTPAR